MDALAKLLKLNAILILCFCLLNIITIRIVSICKFSYPIYKSIPLHIHMLAAISNNTSLNTYVCTAYAKNHVFKKAGISKRDRFFGMHMLRHNAASTMVKQEVPIATIAAILGHSSADTTDIYITTDESRLKECVLPMRIRSPLSVCSAHHEL